MSIPAPARELIARNLQQALECLHADIARVEFWADALGGFTKPIPSYDVADSRLNEFNLSLENGQSGRTEAPGQPEE